MRPYRVSWEIDLDADHPFDAAVQAREMQEDGESTATIFTVTDTETGEEVVLDVRPE